MNTPVTIGSERLQLGEGARWVDGRLVCVDILAGRLLQVEPGDAGGFHELATIDVPLGAVAPIAGHPDRWLVAAGPGIALLQLPNRLTWIACPEDGRPGTMRMNDGTADPNGRFYAGSMDQAGTPDAGRLYRLDLDGSVSVALDGITIPNGPAFDASGRRAYLADSAKGIIWRLAVDPDSGELGDREELVRLDPDDGTPDGMTVDAQDRLWVALWGAGKVACFRPDGTVAQELALPARQPTSVCLTPTSPGCLWVTSATYGLQPPDAADGALFRIPVDATAPPAFSVQLAPDIHELSER